MKVGYLVLLLLCGLMACQNQKHSMHSNSKPLNEATVSVKDSGYILKAEGLALLLKGNFDGIYSDTINLEYYNELKDTDTIGKYYEIENGNLFACIQDLIHSGYGSGQLLCQLAPDHTLLKSEYYSNGMYLCCWDNRYDSFQKHGKYFTLDVCGTGSGYCSTQSYFMRGLEPEHGTTIVRGLWSTWCSGNNLACNLTSDMEYKVDTIIMHYTLKHLKLKRNDTYKVTSSEKFNIKYIQQNSAWIALDSTKINEFSNM
jgi:hypothetical protein